jgi:hypothetical protein
MVAHRTGGVSVSAFMNRPRSVLRVARAGGGLGRNPGGTFGATKGRRTSTLTVGGGDVTIQWRRNADAALATAAAREKPVLLDFSAAPL